MDNAQAISILTAASQNLSVEIGQRQKEKDAFDFALSLLTDGYQADQEANAAAIADGIAAGVDSAVAAATAPLAAQIDTLTTTVTDLEADV